MREMCSVESVLNQQIPKAMLVTSEGSWLFQILTEPHPQLVQFVGIGASDLLPLERPRYCLKDSLLNMAILVFVANNEADVFAPLQRIVTLEDEAFVLRLDEGEASRKTGEHSAHATSDDLLKSVDEQELFWSRAGSSEMAKTMLGECRFCSSRARCFQQTICCWE
jgi:hypothetical protein